jgi:16S rRNA (cytidine1402-2'-O)-methyltransferase
MTPEIGTLYIVATPIGNIRDITLRALDILREVDVIVCEESKEGAGLLRRLEVAPKTLIPLNEHNEQDQINDLLVRLTKGENLALVSDCGTPVFADPGHMLIEQVAAAGFPVVPIPGPSSLMATLSILDTPLERFVFGGFLPRDPEERRRELGRLRAFRLPVILMDTPYRLTALLQDVAKMFGKGQRVTLACNLTLPNEIIFRGPVQDVIHQAGGRKAEFILVLHGAAETTEKPRR